MPQLKQNIIFNMIFTMGGSCEGWTEMVGLLTQQTSDSTATN